MQNVPCQSVELHMYMCLMVERRLLGYIQVIHMSVYDPGLPVSLKQIPSVSGGILWPTMVDGVGGQICSCITRGI